MSMLQASVTALWFVVSLSVMMQIIVLRQTRRLAPDNNGIPPGNRFPDIVLESLTGKQNLTYEDIMGGGNSLMFCFVHSSCKFCREIAPHLERVSHAYGAFRPILLSFDDPDQISVFLRETNVNLPVYRVEATTVTKKLNLKRFPFGMLIDREGIVMRREVLKKETLLSWLVDIPKYVESMDGQGRGAS
ncbi:AhpC/TSA family protein [Paenibacillus cellulosilyticus]|uniref:AhpC/TSA family protein n=1 Tax=Paenibacillus cellulosilyticus TaxID=375489 RepID=A0A2V2YQN1_9BACL|nr:redoxin domain-containing protein [Paenibacillus cellulosilyticus]PWV95965.1 AhpC/TSA family protein [Paenibacillus cellulosilyticus]QKS48433.1 redoxin domain-containing protein [Paenibacillus cellulosilyticus]